MEDLTVGHQQYKKSICLGPQLETLDLDISSDFTGKRSFPGHHQGKNWHCGIYPNGTTSTRLDTNSTLSFRIHNSFNGPRSPSLERIIANTPYSKQIPKFHSEHG